MGENPHTFNSCLCNRGGVPTAALTSPLQRTRLTTMRWVFLYFDQSGAVGYGKVGLSIQGPCPFLQASGYSSLEDSSNSHELSRQNSIHLDHDFSYMARESEKMMGQLALFGSFSNLTFLSLDYMPSIFTAKLTFSGPNGYSSTRRNSSVEEDDRGKRSHAANVSCYP